jgi:hypothetical protein
MADQVADQPFRIYCCLVAAEGDDTEFQGVAYRSVVGSIMEIRELVGGKETRPSVNRSVPDESITGRSRARHHRLPAPCFTQTPKPLAGSSGQKTL